MKLFKRAFNFYLDASIHVAFAVYALARVTMLNFDITYDAVIANALFFGTIVEYSFIKYSPLAKHYVFITQKYIKSIQLFSMLCFLFAAYYIFKLNLKTLVSAAGLVILAFLYVVPALSTKRNFRSLKGVKIYIVGITWSVSTVILPLLNNDLPITTTAVLEMIQRFVFIIILMIPFEIRDLKTDESWLHTLPQVLGVRGVKRVGVLLVGVFLVLTFFKSELYIDHGVMYVEVVVGLILLTAILFSKKKQAVYFSSFFVESIPIIWWLLLLLCS